jgi:hypothetical protein
MVPMLSQRQEDVWGSGVQLHALVWGLGGNALWLGSWPGHRLFWVRFLMVFLRLSRHMPEQDPKLRPARFLSRLFEFIIH